METAVTHIGGCWAILHRLNNVPHISCTRSLAARCNQLNSPPSQMILVQLADRDQEDRPADVQHASSISRNTAHFHSGELDTVRSDDILDIPACQPFLSVH